MFHSSLRATGTRIAAIAVTSTLGFALLASPASAAQVATGHATSAIGAVTSSAAKSTKNTVTISKIGDKKVAKGKSVTIKASVKTAGKVKVKSKTLTVVKSGKTVAKNKASVSLKAGTYTVTTTVKYTVGSSTAVKTKTLKQTLKISTKATKNRVPGTGGYDCPSGFPVKGNADSGIYHVKGGQYYSRTKPEECFTTPAAAEAAGYRASKR